MSTVEIVVLGAGVSGHTAALFLKRDLGHKANVTVISPEEKYNWIPSNIWVGVNQMRPEDVLIPLSPVYKDQNINFLRGKAVELFPEGDAMKYCKARCMKYVNYISTISSASQIQKRRWSKICEGC